MRSAYLNALYDLAQKDARIVSLVADNGLIVYDKFKRDFPDRYFNFGIAESNMVAAAAGMASCGCIPYCYTISSFLAYRAYEFIRDDVCFQNQDVKIIGIGAGLTYSTLGPSHHTTEDIGLLRSLPNLTVFSPSCRAEVQWIVQQSYEINGPVYIRLGNNSKDYYGEKINFRLGIPAIVQEGSDIVIITTGTILNEVIHACELLEREGICAKVLSVHTLKPLYSEGIAQMVIGYEKIVVVEEHNTIGGLYSAIAEALQEHEVKASLLKIGLNDKFAIGYGTVEDVRAANHIEWKSIYNQVKGFCNKE